MELSIYVRLSCELRSTHGSSDARLCDVVLDVCHPSSTHPFVVAQITFSSSIHLWPNLRWCQEQINKICCRELKCDTLERHSFSPAPPFPYPFLPHTLPISKSSVGPAVSFRLYTILPHPILNFTIWLFAAPLKIMALFSLLNLYLSEFETVKISISDYILFRFGKMYTS